LHPSSPDRTFPPSPADPAGNLQFTITDPIDVLTGHEFGHSMSLDHRANLLALMNPGVTDNSGDGTADNIQLNAAEVAALRTNAQNVPGLETDPQGQFDPGRFVVNRQPDLVQENGDLPAQLDLASVRVVLDTQSNRLYMEQQLFGLLPDAGQVVNGAFLLDVDGSETGMTADQLKQLGLPETEFEGVDLVAISRVRRGQLSGSVFILRDGEIVNLDQRVAYSLLTMILHPQFAPLSGPAGRLPQDIDFPVHHIIRLELNNALLGIQLGQPFRLQALMLTNNQVVTDRLDDDPRGREFVLENPTFAHCVPQDDGTPAAVAQVDFDGLVPGAGIHALLGPVMVATGTANGAGGGTIGMPIPADAAPGYHLVTIGVDGTALTADCIINVLAAEPPGAGGIPADEFALLSSHEDLLRRQAQLLDRMGALIENIAVTEAVPTDRVLSLVERYEDLLIRQSDLLAEFASMVRRAVNR
jgi:hypothetical protein